MASIAGRQIRVPHFVFLARPHRQGPSLADAWREAIARYFPSRTEDPNNDQGRRDRSERVPRLPKEAYFTVYEGTLEEILDHNAEPGQEHARIDCVVSPANSFGIMDGG